MEERSEREERDNFLVVNTVVGAATSLLMGYQGWLQEEVKELTLRAAVCSASCSDPLQSHIEQRINRLRDIQQYELDEAVRALRSKIKEINESAYDSIIDARRYLEDGLYRFESLVRECLECRRLLDGLEGTPGDDESESHE